MKNILSIKTTFSCGKKHRIINIFGIKFKFGLKADLNNKIIIVDENGIERPLRKNEKITGLNLDIRSSNNVIRLHKPFGFKKDFPSDIKIMDNSCGNYVEINGTKFHHIFHVEISNGDNQKFIIGKNSLISESVFYLYEKDRSIKIGEDCLFSANLYFINSDAHSILDKNMKLVNCGGDIVIGNHVWIGNHSYFTKNAKVSDNSIVGAMSVVTKEFTQEGVIIAGNPARVVKSLDGGTWSKESPSFYCK